MALEAQDKISIITKDPERNDGVSDRMCADWFEQEARDGEWRDARWLEVTESFLVYGSPMTTFLGSESVAQGLERLDISTLHIDENAFEALLNNDAMTSLTHLELGPVKSSNTLQRLVESPHLKGLRTLVISTKGLSKKDCEAFTKDARPWQKLEFIDSKTKNHLAALLGSSATAKLESLGFRGCALSEKDVSALAESTCISTLRTLELVNSRLATSAKGLSQIGELLSHHDAYALEELTCWNQGHKNQSFASWPEGALNKLTVLRLPSCSLTPEQLAELVAHPVCDGIRTLDLRFNTKLRDAGARHIADAPRLSKLERLDLEDCKLSIVGVRLLLGAKGLGLTKERLNTGTLVAPPNNARLQGIDKLLSMLESGMLDHDSKLDLQGMPLDDEMIELLTTHQSAKRIVTLDLDRCQLEDAQLLTLLGKKSKLSKLKHLSVGQNNITNDVMEPLSELTKLKKLHTIDLTYNRIGASGVHKITGGSSWKGIYVEGNEASTGPQDDISNLIDDYWTSSTGDIIDIVDEAR